MKLSYLATALAAAIVIPATASAATVYKNDTTTLKIGGRVEVRGNLSDNNQDNGQGSRYNDASRVRLSFEGTQKLNDDVTFVGKYENEITQKTDAGSDDTAINTRYLFAGVDTTYGNITYGNQDNATTYLTNFSDMAETFSGYNNEYNNATKDRSKNTLRYEFATGKLNVQVSGNFNANNNASGAGAMAAYKLTDNLELAIAGAYSDQGYGKTNTSITNTPTYDLNGVENGYTSTSTTTSTGDTANNTAGLMGVKYTNGGLWLAATYQGGQMAGTNGNGQTFTDVNYNATDAYAGYAFGKNNVDMTYSYYNADGSDLSNYDINFIGVEYARYVGNAAFYTSYKFNLLDDSSHSDSTQMGDNTDNEFQFGMRYSF
ncbi:porin [Vibrio sp. SS-MA-C1-2]|uniref:porin n=1 Tax=Vibrio sp. SS-MA-C1-2 TaxID=2908646 RepID=UPI001F1DA1CC|nr:porin [Vibrio sp. SS-MA-C1-2]UJF18659.1 porin [Vibrio sp. SS-MA-C1-2]